MAELTNITNHLTKGKYYQTDWVVPVSASNEIAENEIENLIHNGCMIISGDHHNAVLIQRYWFPEEGDLCYKDVYSDDYLEINNILFPVGKGTKYHHYITVPFVRT